MKHLRLTLPSSTMSDPHKHAMARCRAAARAARPKTAFDFAVTKLGQTKDGRVALWYESSAGPQALAVANAILPQIDGLMAGNDQIFGGQGRAGNILLVALDGATDGSTGAYHYGCDFTSGSDWYEDLAFGNPRLTLGLVQAEVVESYMGLQNKGWGCGDSHGEALSRFLAEMVSGGPDGALLDYSTGPAWAQAGFPNWIDATEPTDGDPISIGCGMVYLWWLVKRGFTPSQIVQAGCPARTLGSNYSALGLGPTAWPDFLAAVEKLPVITGDNPWGVAPPPPPPPMGGVLTAQDIANLKAAQAAIAAILAEQVGK
jgi:hypothetical protein